MFKQHTGPLIGPTITLLHILVELWFVVVVVTPLF